MKEKYPQSNFNQALWLSISSFSTFAVTLLSAAILSRYFNKAEYGTYRQILYVFTTLQVVFTAGLPGVFAYFIPRLTHGQGKHLVNSINRVFVLIGLAFSIFLYLTSGLIADILKNPELSIGLKIFSPFPLFTIPALGVEGIYTALKKTKSIFFYHVFNKSLMFLCIVLPVILLHGTYRSAIIGWGIASFITFLVAMYLKNKPYTEIKKELIPNMYKTVFNYSTPLMGASLVGMALHSANTFFISRYYGTDVFAEFSNGYITIPFIGMIAGSVKSVLLPLFSKADSEGNMKEALETYNKSVFQSISLIYPLIFFCLFFAKDIVVILYGPQYEASKSFLQVSLLRDFAEVIPYLSVLLAMGKSNIYFYIHSIAAIIIWGVDFVIVYQKLPVVLIALTHALIQLAIVLSSLVYIYINYKIALLNRSLIKHILIIVIHLTVVLALMLLVKHWIMQTWNIFLTLIVLVILYYGIIMVSGKLIKIDYGTQILNRIRLIYQ
ncbi:MAG: oligosaccharide flippase family protein [Bacteroidales bacterium]|nr:oligosaccharide flippase family protein [Bacteroidales bacterium]